MYLIMNVICGMIMFLGGYTFGFNSRMKSLKQKILELKIIREEVKEKNNKMVSNIARIYELSGNDTSKFTEADEMMMDMWIE